MDPLFAYTNVVHSTSLFHSVFSACFFPFHRIQQQFYHIKVALITPAVEKDTPPITQKNSVILAAITPAQTTTQLLLLSHSTPNTQQQQACLILPPPQKITDLSMLLQIPVSSSGVGHLEPLINKKELRGDPSAAQQPKRPAWTETHAYLRGSSRTNCDHLRILTTELNMIRASKITRSLRPRRAHIKKRKDEFVWGNPSSLRISSTNH